MVKIDFEKLSRYKTADESPGFLLWRTHLAWKKKIEAALAPHAITHIQFVLLAGLSYLTKEGVDVTQHELASFTHCDKTMTSQVLRKLEKLNLITRTHKEGDERAKYPSVTPLGLKKLKAAMKDVEAADTLFFGRLEKDTPRFIKDLNALLSPQEDSIA